MSRRHLSADEPGCTWEYGWDPQRQTFYAHLLAGSGPLAHFGTRTREIDSADVLMYLMGMRLSDERVAVLEHDRLTDSEEVETGSSAGPGGRRAAALAGRGAPRLGSSSPRGR